MDDKQYANQYWRLVDNAHAEMIKRMKKYPIADKIQIVLDYFHKIDMNGNLTAQQVNRLHREIDKWKKKKIAEWPFKLVVRDLKHRTRIRALEALDAWLTAVYLEYYRHLDELNRISLTAIANSHYHIATPAKKRKKLYCADDIFDDLLLLLTGYLGAEYWQCLHTDAAYRAGRIRQQAVIDQQQDKNSEAESGEISKIIQTGNNWLLKANNGGYSGFFDRVAAFFAGEATLQGYKDSGVQDVRFVATVDDRTTEECLTLNQRIFNVDDLVVGVNAPPIAWPPHPCRSLLRAVHIGGNETDYIRIRGFADMPQDMKEYVLGELMALPTAHLELLQDTIRDIIITNDGVSGYDRKSGIVYLLENPEPGELIHEMAHALETKLDLWNDQEFVAIVKRLADETTPFDIVNDKETFTKEITRISSNRFVSEYQGRIYDVEHAFDGGKLDYHKLGEYFSEGYKDYLLYPEHLKNVDSDLYEFIKRRLG